jgi:hypothetical protein
MHDDQQAIPETQEGFSEEYKFPYLHLFTGLVLSCISFIVLISIWSAIILRSETFRDLNVLPPVLMAYLVPELLIISTLIWLANRKYRLSERSYMSSYITMIVVNVLCFIFICTLMGSIQC